MHFRFDGRELPAHEGEPIAAALLANGIRVIRSQLATGAPRGLYCGIGHCFECIATVNGVPGLRTCLTPVQDGMDVSSSAS
ncbi:MAG TPA: (2Fe-2S)-binding protein [Candidatus Limnocylindria bacterium]